MPFSMAYRAAVRGKVRGLQHVEPEVSATDRAAALEEARAHWLLALGELEDPGRRPGLVLIGGLPGTGKSTLARGLAERAGFTLIRSDEVRKELAGLVGMQPAPADYREGIYSPEWTERTYAECARRVEGLLFEGRRVVVDASFGREAARIPFLELAMRWGVPAIFLLCRAEPAVVRARIEGRRQDASDADWSVYCKAAERWEEPGPATLPRTSEIVNDGDRERALALASGVLRDPGLGG